jgi:2-polyprenyl-3-methyl-5-hydroxy-6-metoxy-1,4-benzoquinol methylase
MGPSKLRRFVMKSDEKHKTGREQSNDRRSYRHPPWNISLTILGPFRKLFEPPQKLVEPYVKKGQVAADLGCGPGYYTLVLAESVGSEGKVYAVDLDKKCIGTLDKKKGEAKRQNIEAHATSAADLSFIKDKSVDFVLANGLL